jgi:hypothetical protein
VFTHFEHKPLLKKRFTLLLHTILAIYFYGWKDDCLKNGIVYNCMQLYTGATMCGVIRYDNPMPTNTRMFDIVLFSNPYLQSIYGFTLFQKENMPHNWHFAPFCIFWCICSPLRSTTVHYLYWVMLKMRKHYTISGLLPFLTLFFHKIFRTKCRMCGN